ncbi:MAG: hypothetical protein B9S32_08890 [Verrucomicrobia bacterium Tous-C9LFEB]|nr:MAG: hypothetical protein B9S32_08890 [Verrucomicrobia bacterium Tous-C9LFEB]
MKALLHRIPLFASPPRLPPQWVPLGKGRAGDVGSAWERDLKKVFHPSQLCFPTGGVDIGRIDFSLVGP